MWTRDLVELIGGLLAAEARNAACRVLHYLQVTQEADGHWAQNMWLDGLPYWHGIQLDEAGFPILLTEQAWRSGILPETELKRLWPMIWQAINYLVCHGPVTMQDRWEENSGYSPFTLAVEISALLAAAELADQAHEPELAAYLRETADLWNDSIERWTYATNTELAKKCGVDGYYVRIAPPEVKDSASLLQSSLTLKNLPPEHTTFPTVDIVSPDALALVRFGLRAADDPRIRNTLKVIDAVLKRDTPYGPAWYRYNHDGYGEHADGSSYNGTGIGRLWPLLTGERAHYELAAGRKDEAIRLLHTMEAFANDGGFFPEQIWDSPDIPEHGLTFGRPSGSAMPLVWAHAEYIKLLRSVREGQVFDMPPYTQKRYLVDHVQSPLFMWRFAHQITYMPQGKRLRIEVQAPAVVRWSIDGWKTTHDVQTSSPNLDLHGVTLPTQTLPSGSKVLFTFCWSLANCWEGINFEVIVQ